jgi:hypothetical protein
VPALSSQLASAGREGESADAARERRLRESARVEERLTYVETIDQVQDELAKVTERGGGVGGKIKHGGRPPHCAHPTLHL